MMKNASRFLSLWFETGSKMHEMSAMVKKLVPALHLPHLIPFIYQLASRLSCQSDPFQETLQQLILAMLKTYPHECIPPLLLLRNGNEIQHDMRNRERFRPDTDKIEASRRILTAAGQKDATLKAAITKIDAISNFYLQIAYVNVPHNHRNRAHKLSTVQGYKQAMAAISGTSVFTS